MINPSIGTLLTSTESRGRMQYTQSHRHWVNWPPQITSFCEVKTGPDGTMLKAGPKRREMNLGMGIALSPAPVVLPNCALAAQDSGGKSCYHHPSTDPLRRRGRNLQRSTVASAVHQSVSHTTTTTLALLGFCSTFILTIYAPTDSPLNPVVKASRWLKLHQPETREVSVESRRSSRRVVSSGVWL